MFRAPAEFRRPDVTLFASEERMVYGYRQNGQLCMIEVVPSFDRPCYLLRRDPTHPPRRASRARHRSTR